jgi:hypothetical protein
MVCTLLSSWFLLSHSIAQTISPKFICSISLGGKQTVGIVSDKALSQIDVQSFGNWVDAWNGVACTDKYGNIVSVRPDGSMQIRLKGYGTAWNRGFAVSNNGKMVATFKEDRLTVVSITGRHVRFSRSISQIASNGLKVQQGVKIQNLPHFGIAWAPDGNHFVVSLPRKGSQDSGGQWDTDVYEANVVTGKIRRITIGAPVEFVTPSLIATRTTDGYSIVRLDGKVVKQFPEVLGITTDSKYIYSISNLSEDKLLTSIYSKQSYREISTFDLKLSMNEIDFDGIVCFRTGGRPNL